MKRQSAGQMTTPTAVVGYVRVSTDDQQQSIETQQIAIETWCQAHHLPLLATFVDEAVSGGAALEKRPGLMSALEALPDGSILLVTKRDRLARDVMNAGMIEQLCKKCGASVQTIDGIGDDGTPESLMMRGIVDLFAQYERAVIRLRVQIGMNHKRSKGERISRHLPYGMTVNGDGKTLVPCEAEQRIIATAKALYTDGLSLRKISTSLAEQGMFSRAGTPFTPSTLQTMLA